MARDGWGAVEAVGLKTRVAERSVRSGKRVRELVFSRSDECLDLYVGRFDGTAIGRDPGSMRLEGRLFGYPTCCVENFLTRPYAKNSLARAHQRILFHWACPGCRVTPLLLPRYRRIYRRCRQLSRRRLARADGLRGSPRVASFRRSVAVAASLLALGVTPAVANPDPHWLALGGGDDPDGDYLTSTGLGHFISEAAGSDTDDDGLRDTEEPAFWTCATVRDTDGDSIIDGIEQARALRAQSDSLLGSSGPSGFSQGGASRSSPPALGNARRVVRGLQAQDAGGSRF